ncbi:MAG: DUF4412 domain-containing protein [Candidatus Aminicenantes bacterium]|nr:DUF4412 domain-containing protein [Candidatus Aminicenantes bacterium]NIM80494.1 DUF4412 domain-containing protein [Candidatus Aminicenantes bacterium]NIN23936.1 DUF4412 domain-containing protein [Candidatus Aminicenantes bacterium]NIN47650.1 DUF4412 domain-containing protein [Candidatus Aminicenantes bacterium]NIN90580.1 DUF4412 domain-containing protein [Candidatus Aminicenantes bacterium]
MKVKRYVLLVSVIWFLAFNTFAGVEWVSTITTTGTSKKASNEIISSIYAQKGNLKHEFKSVAKENMFYFQDGYMLYKADSDLIYVVNDKDKSYMELSMDALLQLTGMFGQLVKIEISDHSIKTDVLPDETIQGYPCHHVKITSEYNMKVKIAFIKKTMAMHEVKEIWATPKIEGLEEINKSFLKKDLKTGIPGLDELIQKEIEQQKNLGFPLKMITTSMQKDKKGKVKSETTTTMEVSKVQTRTFPQSFFEIPSDYKRLESPTEGKKLDIF